MIVIEQNWDNTPFKTHQEIIVHDLFDKMIADIIKQANDTNQPRKYDLKKMYKQVDTWLANFANSLLFFWDTDDIKKYYICTIKVLPSGGVLISFIAKLYNCPDPVRLELIY